MATVNNYLQFMYYQDRLDREKKSEEIASVNKALTEFSKVTSFGASTANALTQSATNTYDKNEITESKNKIESLKTGVGYFDNLLDSQLNKIELHETLVGTVNTIEDSLSTMTNTVASSGKPTDGFLKTLEDHRKSLTDNASAIAAPKRVAIENEIKQREEEVEYVTRMSRWDTDMTTPEIDWGTGVTSHTKGYIKDIIEPEAAVARKTGDYSTVNQLLAYGPNRMRTERQTLSSATSKAGKDIFEDNVKHVINKQYGVTESGLQQANKALDALFKNNAGMKSILSGVTTNIGDFGGKSWDARAALDTRKVVESVESDIMMLLNIVNDNKVGALSTGIPSLPKLLKAAGINPETYDPFDPKAKIVIDRFIDSEIYNEVSGFRKTKTFFKETGQGADKAFRSAMTGYLTARKAIHDGVSFVGQKTDKEKRLLNAGNSIAPGWFYPEYESQESDITNPYDN